jgi:hypothetical protein
MAIFETISYGKVIDNTMVIFQTIRDVIDMDNIDGFVKILCPPKVLKKKKINNFIAVPMTPVPNIYDNVELSHRIIHYILDQNKYDFIKCLIDNNISLMIEDVFYMALKSNNFDIIQLLVDKNAITKELAINALTYDTKCVDLLINNKYYDLTCDEDLNQVLCHIIFNDKAQMLKIILAEMQESKYVPYILDDSNYTFDNNDHIPKINKKISLIFNLNTNYIERIVENKAYNCFRMLFNCDVENKIIPKTFPKCMLSRQALKNMFKWMCKNNIFDMKSEDFEEYLC